MGIRDNTPDCTVGKKLEVDMPVNGGSCSGDDICTLAEVKGVTMSYLGFSSECCAWMKKPSGTLPTNCPPTKYCVETSNIIKKASLFNALNQTEFTNSSAP